MPTEVLFNPFPKQMEFLEAAFGGKFNVILYGGAIRGGKTFGGLGTLILLAKAYPNTRWAAVRDTLPSLKRTTIPSFLKICPKAFIKHYNQADQIVTFTNGSQLIFFPENFDNDKELNRWKGLEVNGFLLEEMNEIQLLSFYKAIERSGSHIPAGGKEKPHPLILATCNPTLGWVKELIHDPWRKGTLPKSWHYIPSKVTDNPFIANDEAYMANLATLPAQQYQVFVEGDWDALQMDGSIWKRWFKVVPDDVFPSPEDMDRVASYWDLAYTEKQENSASAYVTIGVSNNDNSKWIFDLGFEWLEFPDLIAWMKTKKAPHKIEGKAAGKSAVQTLRKDGVGASEMQVVGGDKIARANMATIVASRGDVYIKASLIDKLYNDSKQGILFFPIAPNDDLADALAMALQDVNVKEGAEPMGVSIGNEMNRLQEAFRKSGKNTSMAIADREEDFEDY